MNCGRTSDRLRKDDVKFVFTSLLFVEHRNAAKGSEALFHQLTHAILQIRNRIGCNYFVVMHF